MKGQVFYKVLASTEDNKLLKLYKNMIKIKYIKKHHSMFMVEEFIKYPQKEYMMFGCSCTLNTFGSEITEATGVS